MGKCKWREMVAVMKYQCILDHRITCNNYNYIMHFKNSHFTAFTAQYLSSAKQFVTKLNCTLCTLAAHGVHVIVAPQSLTACEHKKAQFFHSLRHSSAVVQCSSNFLKFSLQALSLQLNSCSRSSFFRVAMLFV